MGKGGNNYGFNLVFIIKINSTMIFNNKKRNGGIQSKFQIESYRYIQSPNLVVQITI
jgi:hypothetical protein